MSTTHTCDACKKKIIHLQKVRIEPINPNGNYKLDFCSKCLLTVEKYLARKCGYKI